MTTAHRVEITLKEDGKLMIDDLPFRAGQAVEVIVLPAVRPEGEAAPSIRGMVLRFDDPTSPVAGDDWDAAR